MTTDPQFPPRDRLFALIASIPGSGAFDWCGPARALLDEIEAAAPPAPADRAALREQVAEALYVHDHPGWRVPLRESDVEPVYRERAVAVLSALPDTARLHDETLTLRAEQAEMRDLLRSENERANSAIDREETAEQATEEARQEVRRLGLMVDEYGQGASALTDKLYRARDMHRETCPLARGGVQPPAFRCGMCEVLDAPAVLPPAADRAASYRVATDAIESMQGYPHLILPEEIVAALRLLAGGEQPDPGSPAYIRRPAAGERDEQQTQQGDGAAPEEALDLSDGPVRCPLCPYPVTLHTPNGARAHFTTVHPEQRITGRGSGPWPLLTTDGDEEQQAETQAHQPSRAWKVESPRRDKWASWGATYDEREWAQQMYDSVIETAAQRPFRLVRAETTYTVEAEHVPTTRPAVVAEPGKENGRG